MDMREPTDLEVEREYEKFMRCIRDGASIAQDSLEVINDTQEIGKGGPEMKNAITKKMDKLIQRIEDNPCIKADTKEKTVTFIKAANLGLTGNEVEMSTKLMYYALDSIAEKKDKKNLNLSEA